MQGKGFGASLTILVVVLVIFYTWLVLWTRQVDRSIKAASRPVEKYTRDYYKDPVTGQIAPKRSKSPATLPTSGGASPEVR
jgi:hypothetical protein